MSEITGLVRNALERGWPVQEVKQSLLNAGYMPQEIELEITSTNLSGYQSNAPQISSSPQSLKNYQTLPTEKKSSNKLLFAILAILFLLAIGSLAAFFLIK